VTVGASAAGLTAYRVLILPTQSLVSPDSRARRVRTLRALSYHPRDLGDGGALRDCSAAIMPFFSDNAALRQTWRHRYPLRRV
jgi:hypothetical protein